MPTLTDGMSNEKKTVYLSSILNEISLRLLALCLNKYESVDSVGLKIQAANHSA